MGRRLRGCRSGGVRGGGFRSVSGGKSSARGLNLSVSQQQEDLIKDYPGTASSILLRPKLGGGPRLASSSSHGDDEEEEYPYGYCQRTLMYYYDAVRVCGSDCTLAVGTRGFLADLCGIEVSPDVSEKKASDVAAAAAAAAAAAHL